MFVIELTYVAPLSEIDGAMSAHVQFLKRHYATGTFIASGRKIPRDGGVILTTGKSREELDAIMQTDPFCSRGLAEFRLIEFRVSQRSPSLQQLFDAEPSR